MLLVWATSAATVAAAPSASASGLAEAPTAAAKATNASRRGFDEAKAAADAALGDDDWETLLHEAERALRLLPENDDTHAERAEVMQPVGAYKLDARSPAQLRRSAQVLELYLEQLDAAYKEDARPYEDRELARRYLDDIHGLLPKHKPGVPLLGLSPTNVGTPRPPEQDLPPGGRNLIIGGGLSIGVGFVLLIVGITQGVRWKRADDDYEELRAMRERLDPRTEVDAATEWSRAAGGTLGTAVPGIALTGVGVGLLIAGLRKRKASKAHLSVAAGGLEVTF